MKLDLKQYATEQGGHHRWYKVFLSVCMTRDHCETLEYKNIPGPVVFAPHETAAFSSKETAAFLSELLNKFKNRDPQFAEMLSLVVGDYSGKYHVEHMRVAAECMDVGDIMIMPVTIVPRFGLIRMSRYDASFSEKDNCWNVYVREDNGKRLVSTVADADDINVILDQMIGHMQSVS